MAKRSLLGLDVGERRIGVAMADTSVKIAVSYDFIEVDGNEVQQIAELVLRNDIDIIVVGYPRNQSGEPTQQTKYVESFAKNLQDIGPQIEFQDESLTSVKAEEILNSQKKPYSKGEIDSLAASLILEDYLETLC